MSGAFHSSAKQADTSVKVDAFLQNRNLNVLVNWERKADLFTSVTANSSASQTWSLIPLLFFSRLTLVNKLADTSFYLLFFLTLQTKSFSPLLPPPHLCSQVSFLWQEAGYQLLGASPAASPPFPSLPSLPPSLLLSFSPAAQGPSSRWEIRHHDTNKLSPYFKKALRGGVCASLTPARDTMPLRVSWCACVTRVRVNEVCVCEH